jgi:hypothetical protein
MDTWNTIAHLFSYVQIIHLLIFLKLIWLVFNPTI